MITEKQQIAFGFVEENLLWDEICKVLNALQEQETLIAISKDTKGEDRIHASGRADGINLVISTFNWYRENALEKRGLTNK